MSCSKIAGFIYTEYPCAIDSSNQLPKAIDSVTGVTAEVVNRHRESIIAVESELGIQPSGTYATVRARLDALEVGISSIVSSSVVVQKDNVTVVLTGRILNFTGSVNVNATSSTEAEIEILTDGDPGGQETLSETLAFGDTTSGQHITVSNGDYVEFLGSAQAATTGSLRVFSGFNIIGRDASDANDRNILDWSTNQTTIGSTTNALILDGSNIVIKNLVWPSSDGSANQVMKTDGAGNLFFGTVSSGGGGASQTLSETLDLGNFTDGYDIIVSDGDVIRGQNGSDGLDLVLQGGAGVSGTGGNVVIDPGVGSVTDGYVLIDNLKWPTSDGTTGYVLTTDGSGTLSFTENISGGESLSETLAIGDTTSGQHITVSSGDYLEFPGAAQAASAGTLRIAQGFTLSGRDVANSNNRTLIDWSSDDLTVGNTNHDTTVIGLTGTFSGTNSATLSTGGTATVSGTTAINVSSGGTITISGLVTDIDSGTVIIKNLTWPNADGQDGYVMTTDGAGTLSLEPVSGLITSFVPLPVTYNKEMQASQTGGDGYLASTIPILGTPYDGSFVDVRVNGVGYVLGNGVTTRDCYFSDDDGITAKSFQNIIAGDYLYWNGNIAAFDLGLSDIVSLHYVSVSIPIDGYELPDVDDLFSWFRSGFGYETRESGGTTYITEWIDQINGLVLSQSSASAQPILTNISGLNGKQCLLFSGAQYIVCTSATAHSFLHHQAGSSVYIAYRPQSSSEQNARLVSTRSTTGAGLSLFQDLVNQHFGVTAESTTASIFINTSNSNGTCPNNQSHVLSWRLQDGASPEYKSSVNGQTLSGSATWTDGGNSAQALTLGATSGGLRPYTGYIAEVLIYNRRLSDAEDTKVVNYLNTKFEIS